MESPSGERLSERLSSPATPRRRPAPREDRGPAE